MVSTHSSESLRTFLESSDVSVFSDNSGVQPARRTPKKSVSWKGHAREHKAGPITMLHGLQRFEQLSEGSQLSQQQKDLCRPYV
ncbi:MAG: hypothetical protein VXA48_12375 [Deltaproteobacteria bacterium]